MRSKGNLYLALLIASPASFAWECPGDAKMSELEYSWKNSSLVYVATVMAGEYSPEKDYPYRYDLQVNESFKPVGSVEFSIKGDWSVSLALGEKYVFFANGNTLDFCNLVLSFDRQWMEREDVPARRAYVEQILKWADEVDKPRIQE